MARTDNSINITPSLLDRLLDYEPDATRESPKSRVRSLRELKQSVRRDLEWLLNSRINPNEIPEDLEEVNKSLAVYGLPDFTGASVKSPVEQKRLLNALERAIRIFEPRLTDLNISLDPMFETERALRFRIEAQLNVDPILEPISFDTVLQMGSGEFQVKEN